MENIDPVLILEPVAFMAFGAGTVLYWRRKRRLAGTVLLLSLIAYAGAIALKEVIQYFTFNPFSDYFGYVSWQTGLYFGLQTSFFEVGLAYLVARYAVGRKYMGAPDAEGYGVSLAFWENAILLGALTFLNLVATYVIISAGLLPQSVYQTLVADNPSVFYSPQQLAVPIAFAILERVSSFLAHFAWGYLTVLGAALRKPVYVLVALPMGLIDALVPFLGNFALWQSEAMILALSLVCLFVALFATRGYREGRIQPSSQGQAPVDVGAEIPSSN